MKCRGGVEDAFALSRTAHYLASSYYALLVGLYVAANPLSINTLPLSQLGGNSSGELERKDGSAHTLDMTFYLEQLQRDQIFQTDAIRSWASGSLLTLANELDRYDYFDHAPVLELVYHLRNGIAHGNQFNILPSGKKRLGNYPAHNREAYASSPLGTRFEITPEQAGKVLFDYMASGDIIDLLQSVEVHLSKLAGAWT